jgi:hypothetical protein
VAEPTGSDAVAIIAAARAGSTGGRQGEEVGFATDSPVEGTGFEPSVPRGKGPTLRVSVLLRSRLVGRYGTARIGDLAGTEPVTPGKEAAGCIMMASRPI